VDAIDADRAMAASQLPAFLSPRLSLSLSSVPLFFFYFLLLVFLIEMWSASGVPPGKFFFKFFSF